VAGEAELWATHAALSSEPEYQQQMTKAGLLMGRQADAASRRNMQRLARLEAAAQEFDAKMDAAASGLLAGKRKPIRPTDDADTLARARAVIQLAGTPDALAEAVGKALGRVADVAPNVAAQVSTTAAAATAFLASKAPKEPGGGLDVPALKRPWKPSSAEVARFSRYLSAVTSPANVLEDMAAGAVAPESVEALRAVYPALFADVQQRLSERLARHGTALDYHQRLAVRHVLGATAVDGPSAAARTLTLQANLSGEGGRQQGQRPSSPTPGNVAQRLRSERSPSERLASR
jgi:hypothetical protein